MSKYGKVTALILETREELVKRFPNCFLPKGVLKKPIKVGIKHDLFKRCPDIPADLLVRSLGDYCGGISYQVAVSVAGAARYDLDGYECGVVLEKHSADAVTNLKRRPAAILQKWLDVAGVVLPEPKGSVEMKNPAEAVAATG